MAGQEFRAEFGPGPIQTPTWRVRMTPAEVTAIVDAAAAAGKIHPRSRDGWLVRAARGGREGAQAVSDLLALVPADAVTRAGWVRAGADLPDPEDPEGVYGTLYPEAPPPRQYGAEPDRLGQVDVRRGWMSAHAAAGEVPEPGGHGALSAEHEHEHADYAGGLHTHLHVHRGDGHHRPGAGHGHRLPAGPDMAAAAGIRARRAERATDPGDFNTDSDESLYDRLFGRPL